MKKLTVLLLLAISLTSCCLGQIPTQYLNANDSCIAFLPNYLEFVTVRDNCQGVTLTQIPVPGTILDAANPWVTVTITATDISGLKDTEEFNVILNDAQPPEIIWDSIPGDTIAANFESISQIMTAYHNQLGKYIDFHGGMDGVFHKKQLVTISGPGYDSDNFGIFYTTGHYILGLDSSQMADNMGIVIDPKPIFINAGSDQDKFYKSDGYMFTYVSDTINLDEPYKSERCGNFTYNIVTGPGTFNLGLFFAEVYWNEPGKRIFDVVIEGKKLLENFDILEHVDHGVVYAEHYIIEVVDNSIDIHFTSIQDYAKVSAIMVNKYFEPITAQK